MDEIKTMNDKSTTWSGGIPAFPARFRDHKIPIKKAMASNMP